MSPATMYEQGIELSRNYDKRDIDDTKQLYSILQDAVRLAQLKNDRESKDAIKFLTKVFEPFIIKTTQRVHSRISDFEEFEDVLQDTYSIFIQLTYKYDERISSFAYYIHKMLYKCVRAWAKKYYSTKIHPVDTTQIEILNPRHKVKTSSDIYDEFDEYILLEEYHSYIQERAIKHSKTNTVKIICDRHFMSNESCSNIAQDLGITYQAVYLVIEKIKKELQYFFHHSKYTDYRFHTNVVGERGKNRIGKGD